MNDNLARILSEKEVFRKLPDRERTLLAEHALRRQLDADAFLCRQGEIWPYVVLVTAGQLRWVMLSSSGKEHQLFALQSGDVFWSHSLFDDQPLPASLQASDRVEVYVWPRDVILPLLKKYPEAMWEIPRLLTRIMRQAREIIYGLAFQPVAGRLAKYLMEHVGDPEKETLEREMTLEEMAAVLATSPEVVCRLLYQLQSDEVIKITRTHITLKDREALQKIIELS